MNQHLKVNITSNQLSKATKDQMWGIYKKYYFYTKAEFLKRIEKNNFYSFYTVNQQIVGFTGLRVNRLELNGKKQCLIYFGQTVIDRKYRGQSLIPITGAKLCLKFWKDLLFSDVYFWADTLTYKAYLVFAKTVGEMYPSRKKEMPIKIKTLVDHIGSFYYRTTYCNRTGTIHKSKILVNDNTMCIPQKYIQDKDICFFVKANPLYKQGHGLITITPMNCSNLINLFSRQLRRLLGWKFTRPIPKINESLTRAQAF